MIIALQALGRGPIIATDLSPIRLAVAEKLGVDAGPGRQPGLGLRSLERVGFTPATISALLDRGAPDRLGVTIYECSGAHGMIPRLMETAPPHSSIVVAGISMAPDSISAISGIMRELTIGYALAYRPEEVALSLQRIARGPSRYFRAGHGHRAPGRDAVGVRGLAQDRAGEDPDRAGSLA